MDLNLFKVLDAIYAEGNLTRAAERLNLSQPAVSHALGRLRDAFGDELFTRRGNLMIPTQVTRAVIDDIRESLHKLNVSIQHAQLFEPFSSQKRFVISLRNILESTCLPPLMALVEKQAPGLGITSVIIERQDMERRLASGDIDLAVDVLLPVSDNICHQLLTDDQLVVLAREDHPRIRGNCSIETYFLQRHILVSSRSQGLGREDFELSRLGWQRDIGLRCQHYFSACRVVQETDMLLTMPKTYAQILQRSIPNQLVPLPVSLPVLDVHMYWHTNVDADAANLWLRQQILASMNVAEHNNPKF